jgi:hypothetical protein
MRIADYGLHGLKDLANPQSAMQHNIQTNLSALGAGSVTFRLSFGPFPL